MCAHPRRMHRPRDRSISLRRDNARDLQDRRDDQHGPDVRNADRKGVPVMRRAGAGGSRGQVLVIAVGGMFAMIALVALVVDGGNAWAQQRIVQNGADSAAESGAVVLGEKFANATLSGFSSWDAKVQARVSASAVANNMTVKAAYYTDVCGIPIQSDGTAALGVDGTENLAIAAPVGGGDPATSAIDRDCANVAPDSPVRAAGVLVLGEKNVPTYFGSLVNLAT